MIYVVEQLLNGVQFGVMLFLMAAGLTLIFGIMNVINLAHGSLYMLGAYAAAAGFAASGSFLVGLIAALAASVAVGVGLELAVFRTLYRRDHLDQVLATFGLILFFNELVRIVWGSTALYARIPSFLSGRIEILPGTPYPVYRLAIIAVGLAVALFLYLLIARTRLGMLIRAGASNRVMLGALGVNITAALHVCVRPRRGAGGARGSDGRPDLHGQVRDGRGCADLGLCRDRDRRHRFDPRRVCRLPAGRHRRRDGARLSAPVAGAGDGRRRGGQRRPGAGFDADLHPDGGGIVRPAAGPVSAAAAMRRHVSLAVGGFALAIGARGIATLLATVKAAGQAILVIDRNIAPLLVLADRHYVLDRGRTVWSGSSAELAANVELQHRYLGV